MSTDKSCLNLFIFYSRFKLVFVMLTKPGGRSRSIFGIHLDVPEDASAPAARLRQHDKKRPIQA